MYNIKSSQLLPLLFFLISNVSAFHEDTMKMLKEEVYSYEIKQFGSVRTMKEIGLHTISENHSALLYRDLGKTSDVVYYVPTTQHNTT